MLYLLLKLKFGGLTFIGHGLVLRVFLIFICYIILLGKTFKIVYIANIIFNK